MCTQLRFCTPRPIRDDATTAKEKGARACAKHVRPGRTQATCRSSSSSALWPVALFPGTRLKCSPVTGPCSVVLSRSSAFAACALTRLKRVSAGPALFTATRRAGWPASSCCVCLPLHCVHTAPAPSLLFRASSLLGAFFFTLRFCVLPPSAAVLDMGSSAERCKSALETRWPQHLHTRPVPFLRMRTVVRVPPVPVRNP